MKIRITNLITVMICLLLTNIIWAGIPANYKAKNNYLIISTKSPPALIYVTNSTGQMSGVGPTMTLDQNGILENKSQILSNIPNSQAEEQNMGDPDNNFAPESTTPWMITILDGGSQTYTINLQGITAGIQQVQIKDLPLGKPSNPLGITYQVLVQPGVTKQLQVAVNTTSHSFTVTPVVGNEGLLNDIKSACSQDLIEHLVCVFLTEKAERIQKALAHHHEDEAKELLRSFLCNLGVLSGDGDDDHDRHELIKEPALDILKADAEALLNTIPSYKEHWF